MSWQYPLTIQKPLDNPWCTRNTWRLEFLTGIEIWTRRGDHLLNDNWRHYWELKNK